ncbi:MAG: carboxypeptidase-like regulatory domain-containing protein [Bacteroidetes bacterium]|nr:carboxypeptidase-like regulatory domain-containing protein [Bacteroidota bacterium]
MRIRLLLPTLLCSFFSAQAQQNLSSSPQQGLWAYAWRISDKEALYLYTHYMKDWDKNNLHTLVDSFPSNEPNSALPAGNYLFVRAEGSNLSVAMQTIGPLRYELLNNGPNAALSLHTPEGAIIRDADLYIRKRRVLYDSTTASYPLGRWKKDQLVKIVDHGALYYFPVIHQHGDNRPFLRLPLWLRRLTAHRYIRRAYKMGSPRFNSFMVFGKPKYKPGDTVRGKAFIMDKKGRPIDRPLDLRLYKSYAEDTLLMTVTPYRPGGYEFSFILNDSFKLTLDKEYRVQLTQEEKKIRRSAAASSFRYEEYELNSVHFEARTNQVEHGPGEATSIFLRASDENDLPIPDGRVELTVTSSYGADHFLAPHVFVPDTLWTWKQSLDPVGETRIILPDSIFPKASIHYSIHCVFFNSNNERHEQYLEQHYLSDRGRVFFRAHDDSLDIDYKLDGRQTSAQATLYPIVAGGIEIVPQPISLPAHMPVNSYVNEYQVRVKQPGDADSLTGLYFVYGQPPFSCSSSHTGDSIQFSVANPWRLPFWYNLSIGGRVLLEGQGRQLDYRAKSVSDKTYILSVQYMWGGELRARKFPMAYQERRLQVNIKEPDFVYPGQRATIAIDVRDAEGKPVADADLTAWSYTAKFTDPQQPQVPYLGKNRPYRRYQDYKISRIFDTKELSLPLVWERWGRQLGLSEIEYYKFLNPASIYVNREAAVERVTQVAPFVSRKGRLMPVLLLYIDERLVFYSGAQQTQRYSFPVDPGRHSLRLRIVDKEIRLDSIVLPAGMKTFLCINDDTANRAIRFIKMPDTLARHEKELLRSSMLFLENSFDGNYATIRQGSDRYTLVNGPGDASNRLAYLVGPLRQQSSVLRVEDRFEQAFDVEGGYSFHIQQGLIKEKQWPFSYPFPPLLPYDPSQRLRDQGMTKAAIDSLWQDYLDNRSASQDLYQNPNIKGTETGRLEIGGLVKPGPYKTPLFIRKIFLFRYDDPDYMRIYKGESRQLGVVEAGYYKMLLLLKGDVYLLKDSIRIVKGGLNYYDLNGLGQHPADNFSREISRTLHNLESNYISRVNPVSQPMQRVFNEQYVDVTKFTNMVSGRVLDSKGLPLVGATIGLKNTRNAALTNENGYFQLRTPERGTLVFAYVGYETVEKTITSFGFYEIRMKMVDMNLNEVIVVGYGTSRKRDILEFKSSPINALQGRVPGIFISQATGLGAADMDDVAPYRGNTFINIPSLNAPMTGSTLRTQFHDDAFWQPRLRTDANGTASFSVVYPDDITNWKTLAIAATDHRQTGMSEGRVRAFKPLSANLSLPSFLVTGDQAHVIGKVLNYTPDTVQIRRCFSIDQKANYDETFRLLNSHIDTFTVNPQAADSLHFLYTLQKDDYQDGEQRTIPVFPAGVVENKGHFAALEDDTTVQYRFDTALGPVHVYASASLLPVMLEEIERTRSYEYLCNEQLASRLLALLEKKKIDRLQQKEFKEEKNIADLIAKLLQARKGSPLWGWWPEGASAAWVSLHVTEALLAAEREGYMVQLDKQPIIDYLVYEEENKPGPESLFRIRILQELGAKVNYKKFIDSLEKNLKYRVLHQDIQLQELRLTAGLPTRIDTLVAKRQYTALGNCYWGADSLAFFNNSVQNTAAMYRLLRQAGGYTDLLRKMRDYLLEKRGSGYWRNTYESSLILETLLPDLLADGQPIKAPELRINGQPISDFPYQARLSPAAALNITQSGKLPVYFTAYQSYWNKAPEKVSGTFAVRSWFTEKGTEIQRLKAGEPVTLEVEVDVSGETSYVLIEVPIPAGCSYCNKVQPYSSQEMHREYLKNKLSIFSEYLSKGIHRFYVQLLPRYTGVYQLNPAKAELQYFPVLFGQEGMKKVAIE